jgi:hypothetical protein
VAYLWWQSREPSRYSEWASDLATLPELETRDRLVTGPRARAWAFETPGDSVWRVACADDELSHYRVQLWHGDSTLWRLYLDLAPDGACRSLWWSAAGRIIHVQPQGDSARFRSTGAAMTDAWIAWSPGAVVYEAIPALCDGWARGPAEQTVTLIRIQPVTEVVTQLPGVLRRAPDGSLALIAAGKELVRVTYEAGAAARICLAGGRCLERRAGPAS